MSGAGDGISGLLVPALAAAMTLVAWAALMMRAGRGEQSVEGRIRSMPSTGGVGRGILPLGIGLAVTGFIWAGLDNPLLAAAFLAASLLSLLRAAPAGAVEFNRDIRPLLAEAHALAVEKFDRRVAKR